MSERAAAVSVIVPAHNEGAGIRRLLGELTTARDGREVEVVVACNGCTDDTAEVARSLAGVAVIEIVDASKRLALEAGDAVTRHPRRAYVDADVLVSRHDLLAVVDAVGAGILAAGPERRLALEKAGLAVRWYYDVWQGLPAVRAGLFGRGMIVLSAGGHDRIRRLPSVMSDDLAISEAFTPAERVIVPGTRGRSAPVEIGHWSHVGAHHRDAGRKIFQGLEWKATPVEHGIRIGSQTHCQAPEVAVQIVLGHAVDPLDARAHRQLGEALGCFGGGEVTRADQEKADKAFLDRGEHIQVRSLVELAHDARDGWG